ncbi:hypothetical protein VTL71DRAFT_9781 [Oculimacula yallundae]|uniref:Secreted protein n=1 Tax=Oculimacula yallundae TaxID=86028 RepID=A0ABR4BRV3_9HELO
MSALILSVRKLSLPSCPCRIHVAICLLDRSSVHFPSFPIVAKETGTLANHLCVCVSCINALKKKRKKEKEENLSPGIITPIHHPSIKVHP